MRKKNIQIEDNSKDRKYFTIIPNYVLNHSSHWDREVYIQMKRIAGENGECFIGETDLDNQCGISRDRLRKSLNYLVSNNWIELLGKTNGKISKYNPLGLGSNKYKIIDIWKKNVQFYKDNNNLSSGDRLSNNLSSGDNNLSSGIQKEEPIQEELNTTNVAKQSFAGKDINHLLTLFKKISPTHRFYENVSQRRAMERLVNKFGIEKMESCITMLPAIITKKYAPVITSPIQLENKLGALIVFLQKEKSENKYQINV